ncbi:MAG: 4-hydroxy-tetrahydrodipicolinate synthase [Acetobacteraceae bacterium]|nr:4-hydroxy-tetrahydrodipicolinate synthase [Acetobacteraceae bacterium]
MKDWGRVITAMVTPFGPDLAVDWARAAELARRLVDSGSDGLVVGGTTGESPTLTEAEKLKLWETVVEAVGDRVPVIAGTGTNSTAASVSLTRRAEVAGVDGVMLVTPYYNKPPQEGMYRHFREVAESTRLPVLLYNVPGRTGANLLPETVARLAEVPNIVALKEASGSLEQVAQVVRLAPPGFRVYSGDDSLTLPVLASGGYGVVSVASHLVGQEMQQMVRAYLGGDAAEAARLHLRLTPLFKALFITANPIPVKCALALCGFPVGGLRLPLVEASSGEREALARVLSELGLLPGR